MPVLSFVATCEAQALKRAPTELLPGVDAPTAEVLRLVVHLPHKINEVTARKALQDAAQTTKARKEIQETRYPTPNVVTVFSKKNVADQWNIVSDPRTGMSIFSLFQLLASTVARRLCSVSAPQPP